MDHDSSSDRIAVENGSLGCAVFVFSARFPEELLEGHDRRLGIHFPKVDHFEIAGLAREGFDDLFDGLVVGRSGPSDDVVGLRVQSQVDICLPGELRLQDVHRCLWVGASDVVAPNRDLLGRGRGGFAIGLLDVDLGYKIAEFLKLVRGSRRVEGRSKRVGRDAQIFGDIRVFLEPQKGPCNPEKLLGTHVLQRDRNDLGHPARIGHLGAFDRLADHPQFATRLGHEQLIGRWQRDDRALWTKQRLDLLLGLLDAQACEHENGFANLEIPACVEVLRRYQFGQLTDQAADSVWIASAQVDAQQRTLLANQRVAPVQQHAIHDIHRLGNTVDAVRIAVGERPRREKIGLKAQLCFFGKPLQHIRPRRRVEVHAESEFARNSCRDR